VEVDPDFPCLDFLVSGAALPIQNGWADEVLTVHMIEHISPLELRTTLREWFRILRVGGELRIHTPNGEAIARTLMDSASGAATPFWALQSAIFGYFREIPECTGPEGLREHGDHRLLFTFPELRTLLEEAGFSQVTDISGKDPCSHFVAWEPHVPGLCLEVQAVKTDRVSVRSA
jgi:SAM-dependent methyltransferase